MLRALLDRFFGDGDAAAMETLVLRTRRRLLAIASRIGARQDAEDAVQAAYHALLRHGAFRGPVTVEAWLTATVIRIAYRRKALARREAGLATRLARDRDSTDAHASAVLREETLLVRREVARLPAHYRDVLVLRHLEGLTVEETGRLLDIPPATVKTRTRRGLALLRARVAPRVAWALLAGPWLLADGMRAAAGWGLVMNAKITMAGVALVAAAAGLGSGLVLAGPRAPEPRAHTREARAPSETVTTDAEVALWRERAERAEAALNAARAAPAPPAAGRAQARPAAPDFDARYAAVGGEFGAGPAAMAAAKRAKDAHDGWCAGMSPATQAELSAAVEELRKLGGEGFLALAAHLRATEHPKQDYVSLLSTTYRPGLETHLFAVARDPLATPDQRHHALLGLSIADTAPVRDYLLAELEGASDERIIAGAARSLGWLREERALPTLERLLYRPGMEHQQGPLLDGIGILGTAEARRVLLAYLDKERRSGYLAWGVRALGWSDTAAARDAAKAILAGPHAGNLAQRDRTDLETTAGR